MNNPAPELTDEEKKKKARRKKIVMWILILLGVVFVLLPLVLIATCFGYLAISSWVNR